MGSNETKSRSSSQASTSSLHLASLEDKAWTLGELRSNCAEETRSGSGTERASVRSHSEGLLSTELLLWLGHVGICLSFSGCVDRGMRGWMDGWGRERENE